MAEACDLQADTVLYVISEVCQAGEHFTPLDSGCSRPLEGCHGLL